MVNKWSQYKSFILKWKIVIIIALVLLLIAIFWLKGQDEQPVNDMIKTSDNTSMHNNKDELIKENPTSETTDEKHSENPKIIFVDIKGQVKKPNVYEMKNTDRVIDLVNKAELLETADVTQVNLSEKLSDQKMVYIPKKGETGQIANASLSSSNSGNGQKTAKINLNSATESELQNVPGIGPSKARDIMSYKQEHGSFNQIDDLKKVKGFGAKTFEKLKDYFSV